MAYYVDGGRSRLTRAGTVDLPRPADVYLLPDDADHESDDDE